MLRHTFRHFCSAAKERFLWSQGIRTWKHAASAMESQPLLPGFLAENIYSQSACALASHDSTWFAKRLPVSEHWRIAATFPESALFLDIETTGLSLYYDSITVIGWSMGRTYNFLIAGNQPSEFYAALEKATSLITFNGTCFDLKFISKNLPDASLPPVHVDLRYFARRAGLTGGQKAIERSIGFKRSVRLKDMDGASAMVLWHRFIRGDHSALELLLEYNHADIEGMKAILDSCIAIRCMKDHFPEEIQPYGLFSRFNSKFTGLAASGASRILSVVKKANLVRTTFSRLAESVKLDSLRIAGIDLVASEKRASGLCLLSGNVAETARIKSDAEILSIIKKERVNLVSIDAPLGIPAGRQSCFDEDPYRKEFGIMRQCERILARRGVRSFPCLLPSMQELTSRGINLASKIRSLGIPVIESFPGGAQDILNIPRKQAGLEFLSAGLADFGLEGNFLKDKVSHDELDAITCALVGVFFWTGNFEGLGPWEESRLIVPNLGINSLGWRMRKVFAISGFSCAGKTTVSQLLEEKGCSLVRTRDAVKRLGGGSDPCDERNWLYEAGLRLNRAGQQRALIHDIATQIHDRRWSVVDSMRFLEDRATLQEEFGSSVIHIHVDCDSATRKLRTVQRDGTAVRTKGVLESEVDSLGKLADIRISNNQDMERLKSSIERIWKTECL